MFVSVFGCSGFGEQNDLSAEDPDILKDLKLHFAAWKGKQLQQIVSFKKSTVVFRIS